MLSNARRACGLSPKIFFSPAEVAGLKRGDLITAIDGSKPREEQQDPAFAQPVGRVLHIMVRRDGVERTYEVTLSDVL